MFGSIAKGKATENSDTDICIIVSEKNSSLELKITELVQKYKDLKIEHHIFSKMEFKNNANKKVNLIDEIKKEGFSLKSITDISLEKFENIISEERKRMPGNM